MVVVGTDCIALTGSHPLLTPLCLNQRGSDGLTRHDDRLVKRRPVMQCLSQQATFRGAHYWHVNIKTRSY